MKKTIYILLVTSLVLGACSKNSDNSIEIEGTILKEIRTYKINFPTSSDQDNEVLFSTDIFIEAGNTVLFEKTVDASGNTRLQYSYNENDQLIEVNARIYTGSIQKITFQYESDGRIASTHVELDNIITNTRFEYDNNTIRGYDATNNLRYIYTFNDQNKIESSRSFNESLNEYFEKTYTYNASNLLSSISSKKYRFNSTQEVFVELTDFANTTDYEYQTDIANPSYEAQNSVYLNAILARLEFGANPSSQHVSRFRLLGYSSFILNYDDFIIQSNGLTTEAVVSSNTTSRRIKYYYE